MSAVSWIKIRTDMFSDEKVRLIEQLPEADSILVIWVKLLALAGQKNSGGEIFVNDEMPYTDEMLAAIFHRKVGTVRMALQTFQKFRMIEIARDQTIVITNWAKHQNIEGLERIRQQNLERQKRFRLNQDGTGRRTLRESNVTHNVTDSDSVTQNSVTAPRQSKNKNRKDLLPTVPLQGEGHDVLIRICDRAEAKKLICEKILDGKDAVRSWSPVAETALTRMCEEEGGISRAEIEAIGWFQQFRDKPLTETNLMLYWGDEARRAALERKKRGGGTNKPSKPEPDRWREFFRWKHDNPDMKLPKTYWLLSKNHRDEYDCYFQTFVVAAAEDAAA